MDEQVVTAVGFLIRFVWEPHILAQSESALHDETQKKNHSSGATTQGGALVPKSIRLGRQCKPREMLAHARCDRQV
jgi:hypothetical protein